jgi:hypothetical protein
VLRRLSAASSKLDEAGLRTISVLGIEKYLAMALELERPLIRRSLIR